MTIDTTALKSACRYEQYDPQTLKPLNDSTYIRLIETGWNENTFKGRSVMDIGCNSGALSLFAHQLGASAVRSFDVTQVFVDFFADVVALHKLPISVEKKAFFDLDPAEHASDVVLCMEVLHWIVHQGGSLEGAVAHLASLTNETLYVETPWDNAEPSIANRSDYPVENYDIELIFRALSKHFETVRIEKFMTYFGTMENSKRVLISATGKRTASLPIRHIRDANMSGISLSRGVNESELVTTTQGPKFLKTVPDSSIFARLSDADLGKLGAFLQMQGRQSAIVAPESFGTSICQKEADGRTYMLFPFVGDLASVFPKHENMPFAKEPMPLALKLFEHFSQADESILAPIRSLVPPLPAVAAQDIPEPFAGVIAQKGITAFLERVAAAMSAPDTALDDGLLHNDMQLGNTIHDASGRDRLIDLDLMRTGPAYADILCCAVHASQTGESLTATLEQAAKTYDRPVQFYDVAFSVTSVLRWSIARAGRPEGITTAAVERTADGLAALSALFPE